MLLFISAIKLVCEIALLALLGQWLLGLLAGQKRDKNVFYQTLQVLTKPFVAAARLITPKAVMDRHVPLVAFSLLVVIWFVSLFEKIKVCTQIGMQLCK